MIGVHFQSGYPVFTDEEDAERRRSQCQHLADWIAGEGTADNPALPAPLPGEHVAILGDFNALIESDVPGYEAVVQSLAPLRQGHMADWWWEKPLPDPAGGGQVTSYLEGYLIDFVMLSPSLRSRIVEPPTIYAFDHDEEIGASGLQLSDHRPVYVEIDIRQDETVTPDHPVPADAALSGSRDQKVGETRLHARLALGTRDRALAERHARQLKDLGFTVVQVASRGVSFEGTITQFESTFESEVEASEEGAQFRQAPTIPEAMEEQVDSVYFPTKPTFFAKSVDAGRNPLLSGRGESGRRHPDAK